MVTNPRAVGGTHWSPGVPLERQLGNYLSDGNTSMRPELHGRARNMAENSVMILCMRGLPVQNSGYCNIYCTFKIYDCH